MHISIIPQAKIIPNWPTLPSIYAIELMFILFLGSRKLSFIVVRLARKELALTLKKLSRSCMSLGVAFWWSCECASTMLIWIVWCFLLSLFHPHFTFVYNSSLLIMICWIWWCSCKWNTIIPRIQSILTSVNESSSFCIYLYICPKY